MEWQTLPWAWVFVRILIIIPLGLVRKRKGDRNYPVRQCPSQLSLDHKELYVTRQSITCIWVLYLKSRCYGPLIRYAKLRVAHAPGMPETFSPPPRVSNPDMHHGTCATYVPWCMSGSLTSGFFWSRWWGKRSRHSRRMRNPQFCVFGKRPIQGAASIPWCGLTAIGIFIMNMRRLCGHLIIMIESPQPPYRTLVLQFLHICVNN